MLVFKSSYDVVVQDRDYQLKRIDNLKETHQQEIDRYKIKIKQLETKIEKLYSDELENSEFEVDFKAINAFSIERIAKPDTNKTIIGYIIKEKDCDCVKEWEFSCSAAQHQKLVEQFKKVVLKK